jgi:hypothetical protein
LCPTHCRMSWRDGLVGALFVMYRNPLTDYSDLHCTRADESKLLK